MKKRWTLREIALLLLPVVALGAYGLWTQKKPIEEVSPRKTKTQRFAVVLQSMKVLPATPRDVYEGFDTLVKVKYLSPTLPNLPNARARENLSGDMINPRLIYKSGAKFQRVQLPQNKVNINGTNSDEQTFRCNLSNIPASYGQLTFKAALTQGYAYWLKGLSDKQGYRKVVLPPLDISIVVRKAGETIAVPDVPKWQRFKVKAIARDSFFSQRGREAIKVIFEKFEPTTRDRWRFLRPRLVDSRGKEYDYSILVAKQDVLWVQESGPAFEKPEDRNSIRWFSFPLDLIPKSAGKITFKTEVSLNDGWPKPISYVVRR